VGRDASDHLRANLQRSAYRENGTLVADVLQHSKDASPEVIANIVTRALSAARPRRRYAAPFDAKALIFLRWLLPEGAWAKLIWSAVKAAARSRPRQQRASALPVKRQNGQHPA
jgi:hypothetical protein